MLAGKNWPVLALAAALPLLLMAAAAACGPGDSGIRPAANPTAALSPVAPSPAAEPPTAAAPIPTAMPAPAATRAVMPSPTLEPATAPIPTAAPTPANTLAVPPSPTLESATAPSLLQLADPLDEPEFYCVDVPGFRDSLRTDRPLQAHTCKPGAADELFHADRPESGQFLMPAYALCMTAEGDRVYTRPCADKSDQRFVHRADLTIRTAADDLCLAVAGGKGEPAGGRSHLRRDLRLMPCAAAEPALSQWLLPGSRPALLERETPPG